MDSGFGARLRRHRETRHIELASIADQTKIKQSLLEGLERGDVSRWPSGIFRRSYLRAYAKAVGLDADQTLLEFLSLYPDPAEEARTAVAALASGHDAASQGPATRLRFLIGSAARVLPSRRGPAARHESAPVASDAESGERAWSPHSAPADPGASPVREPEAPPRARIDLSALAQLCTRLACATTQEQVALLLGEAVDQLDIVGLVLWLREPQADVLRPAFAHGYPEEVVAQLPGVAPDSDTAIAASFRSADSCVVESADAGTGAIVVPLLTPAGCSGVLALECRHGCEHDDLLRVSAMFVAAQLSTLVATPPLAHAASA